VISLRSRGFGRSWFHSWFQLRFRRRAEDVLAPCSLFGFNASARAP